MLHWDSEISVESGFLVVITHSCFVLRSSILYFPYILSASANEAEYTGLIIGLELAKELGILSLEIKGDSQTIIYQVLGKYRLNSNSKFLDDLEQVLNLLSYFDDYSLIWIPRRKNQLADRAAHKCLKENCPPEEKNYAEEYIDYLIYSNSYLVDDDYD
jgi:ribonuclease HI